MKIDIPDPSSLDKSTKVVNTLNFIIFLLLFFGIVSFLWYLFPQILLRILSVIAAYVAASLLTFCIIKPLSERAAASMRNRKKQYKTDSDRFFH